MTRRRKSHFSIPFISLLLSPSYALSTQTHSSPGLPMVINTWSGPFTSATDAGYLALISNSSVSALDAVQIGCSRCERNQCDGTVGYGGSPDEKCETTLDAMIMDGRTMKSGAVAALRRVRDAIAVARMVLEHTEHTMLAGDFATDFAVQNGFAEESLTTPESARLCNEWKRGGCQPNYRMNVSPPSTSSCGPYTPLLQADVQHHHRQQDQHRTHDTISLIAIHASGSMAAGTSTNGATHKIPGRVGDAPITGSGSYVDEEVGGCGATGDGDVMMRFLPCYQAVESMRRGMMPSEAADDAVRRMVRKYPAIQVGLVVVNNRGEHAGAASGFEFSYAFRAGEMDHVEVVKVGVEEVEMHHVEVVKVAGEEGEMEL